jgi:chitosanase
MSMDKKPLIKKILLAFEQSTTSIKYDAIYKYNDGPNDKKQITLSFGITEYGNLKILIKNYCFKNGKLTQKLQPYVSKIGSEALVENKEFLSLLKESCSDDIMKECQEEAYDDMYITPAYNFCDKNKLELPLSKLVICDSYLHTGSILSALRNSFSESVPVNGGDEKVWIESYCNSRRNWLATNSRIVLHTTVYRMDFMLDRIKKGDWELAQSPFIANDVKIFS